jgi:hypothetical protein
MKQRESHLIFMPTFLSDQQINTPFSSVKKALLPVFGLLLALGTTQVAHAQVNLIRMGINTAILAKRAAKSGAVAEGTPMSSYQGQSFPMLRTPAEELSGNKGEQTKVLEAELDRCHSALVSTTSGPLYTPEQQAALKTALHNATKAKATNIAAYQQEAAFYLAENTRRQQTLAPAPTTN